MPHRSADPDHPERGMRVYGLDIETDTRSDGLDPLVSAVVSVAMATAHETVVLMGEEDSILRDLDEHLGAIEPGVVVTWNGSRFDLPFLRTRSAIREVDLRWGPHSHLDGYLLYRSDVGRTLPVSCGLKTLSLLAGMAPVEVDRTRIHELNPRELERYVASDAELARELVLRRWTSAQRNIGSFPVAISA